MKNIRLDVTTISLTHELPEGHWTKILVQINQELNVNSLCSNCIHCAFKFKPRANLILRKHHKLCTGYFVLYWLVHSKHKARRDYRTMKNSFTSPTIPHIHVNVCLFIIVPTRSRNSRLVSQRKSSTSKWGKCSAVKQIQKYRKKALMNNCLINLMG